jgi:hypothetical protein
LRKWLSELLSTVTSRVATYFGAIIITLVLINTPVPRVILQALFGETAGNAMAISMRGLTRDIFLLLMVSIYFEWARSREQVALLMEVRTDIAQWFTARPRSD